MRVFGRKVSIELSTDGLTWRGVIRGLTPAELVLSEKASDNYEQFGSEFEKRVGRLIPEVLKEASFWVEGNVLVLDEGR